MTTILIVDDHAIFRRGIKQIFSEIKGKVQIDEAGDGAEAIEKITDTDYNAVFMDISMPGKSGLDVLKQIKIFKPELPVVMLSVYPEEQYAIRALKAGAFGYLTKSSHPDDLMNALETVLEGHKYVSPMFAEKLACYIEAPQHTTLHENLSDREYQVMLLTASGRAVKEIAYELSLSGKTISTYRTRVLSKMNMSNVSELVHYAIKNELIQ